MNTTHPLIVAAARRLAPLACAAFAGAALAHGSSVGSIEIGHPFATPTLAGSNNGAAYLLSIENKGAAADRLLRASTPVAARVELHNMAVDAQGVMRMREVDGIAVEPKAAVRMRPGMGYHLMLIDLKRPLKEGDTFPLQLVFEKAGSVEVRVDVQVPRAGAASHSH